MTLLKVVTMLTLCTAAFLNAATLGEQYGLKRATPKGVIHRVAMFIVYLSLAVLCWKV